MEREKERECLCLDCIYSNQPYGYFPIICVQGKRIKEMWHEVYTCKHCEKCPEPPKQIPWRVTKCDKNDNKE